MRLEEPIPYDIADPFALHNGRVANGEISIASYGRGRAEAITRERSCRILQRRQGLITFDCDITFGSSGSAILAKNGPRWQILSVVSAVSVQGGRKDRIWHGARGRGLGPQSNHAPRRATAQSVDPPVAGRNGQVQFRREIHQLRRGLNSVKMLPM